MRLDPVETKVFDPADGFAPLTDVIEVTDPAVFKRGDRWWMCVGTQVAQRPGIQLAMASLPEGDSGPWKPSAAVSPADPKRLYVFFSGLYSSETASPYLPFVFTLGCVEVSRPETM